MSDGTYQIQETLGKILGASFPSLSKSTSFHENVATSPQFALKLSHFSNLHIAKSFAPNINIFPNQALIIPIFLRLPSPKEVNLNLRHYKKSQLAANFHVPRWLFWNSRWGVKLHSHKKSRSSMSAPHAGIILLAYSSFCALSSRGDS